MTEHMDETVVAPAARRARDTRGRRLGSILTAVCALAVVVLFAVFLNYRNETRADLDALRASSTERITTLSGKADDAARAAQRLGDQVRALGGTPVVQPPQPAAPGVGIRDVVPDHCSLAVVLDDGRRYTLRDLCGAPGKDAPPGRGIASTATDGCFVTVAYTDNSPAARLGPLCGADGKPGANGSSPPCMSEPAQCRGEPGEPGAKGDKGDKGEPGANGAACEPGYERRPARIDAPDGGTYSDGTACVRPDSYRPPTTTTTPARSTPPPVIPNPSR